MEKTQLENIWISGILGLAVGDALGAPAEFGERWMRDEDPVKNMRSGGVFDVPPGGWTDDTAMTLATLDSLKGGFDPADLMSRFVRWLRQGDYSIFSYPIGIVNQILQALERYEVQGDPACCGGREEWDNGNGSLMRILPVCLYGYGKRRRREMELPEVVDMIHRASELTHGHARSLIACGIYYFVAERILEENGSLRQRVRAGVQRAAQFYAADSRYREELLRHYARILDVETLARLPRENISSTGYVVDTLEAALWALVTTQSYRDCVLQAVNLGLDADTIAAVAGGLAGLYYGVEGIEQPWLDTLLQRDRIEAHCAALVEAQF